jgi:tetrahedral aminopeptidase
MKELIMQLSEAVGPAGQEENVRALLKSLVEPYADEVREDVLGNLIATKKGTGANRQHFLLVAHMDEPGLIVTHVDGNGFLRVALIGNHEAAYLVGRRVLFANGAVGVVGTHHVSDAGDVTANGLFLDIGASSKEEALERVSVGDSCVPMQHAFELAPGKVVGKALDNRVGCAVAVEVLKRLDAPEHDISVAFVVQGVVGQRGVKPAAYGVQPDFGLVLGAVHTGDTPGGASIEIALGDGVSVKILDHTVIVPPRIKNFLIDQAEAADIAYQLEVFPDGVTEAGALLTVREGVPTGALSIPVRFTGTGSEMVDLRDVEAAAALTVRALTNYNL